MNKVLAKIGFVCIGIVLMAGCQLPKVYNVTDAPVAQFPGDEPTLEQVSKAILAAGTTTRPAWGMKVMKPGNIRATLHNRTHMAAVEITYNTKTYTITYKDSSDLKYNSADNTIHSGYNKWIQYLDNAIKGKLAAL